jgi:hypothetical protein
MYGLPQNRERVYFVCIRKDIQKKPFVKPSIVKMKPFEAILTSINVVKGEIPRMYQKNLHLINSETLIVTPYNYYFPIKNISPTLTTNCSSFFLIKQNRPITCKEALKLQGI